ncbi:class I SAM-dependent methyltransferase [Simkania sp.]|uniref:class I SAM-dependent methyltransferase n=1 Tax=Simkania sp. TaxID=34094 RepID=UPI003B52F223
MKSFSLKLLAFFFMTLFSFGLGGGASSLVGAQTNQLSLQQAKQNLLKNRTRTDLINYLIVKNNYQSYLEIGVASGDNFNHIQIARKDGVDPHGKPANYHMTSDEFFARYSNKYDIVFIDGLHLCDQVIRDVVNSLASLNEGGMIVMHDCLPVTFENQVPYVIQGAWNGDVWKAAAHIRMHMPDVYFCVLDMDWGCGIVNPSFGQETYPYVPFNDLDWNFYVENRDSLLNVKKVEDYIQP